MIPEKLHLATVHFPMIGGLIAIFVLTVGVILKNKTALLIGLGITLFSFLFTGVIMGSGEEAFLRYSEGGNKSDVLSTEGLAMMKEHEAWTHNSGKIGYLSLFVSLVGLSVYFWKKKGLIVSSIVVLLTNAVFVGISFKAADSGGKIRRPDLIETSEK